MVTVRPYRGDTSRKKWEVDIRFEWPDGNVYRRRVKAPVTSKSGAQRWGERREAVLLSNGPEKHDPEVEEVTRTVPTIAEYKDTFLGKYAAGQGQKKSGIDAKESILRLHLIPHLTGRPLDDITSADQADLVALWKAGTKHTRGTSCHKTINNRLTVLKKLLAVAWEWENLVGEPPHFSLLKVEDVRVAFYEFDEYRELCRKARQLDERILIATLLGGDAGLRRGEIMALRRDRDIDFHRRHIHIQRSIVRGVEDAPKGVKTRVVPMTRRLAKALKRHRHNHGPRVLYRDGGGELSPSTIRHWMERAEREAGLPVSGKCHILRHTFCAHLAMRNQPIVTIQQLAGHKQIETTMRYMHLVKDAKRDAIDALSNGQEDPDDD